MSYLILKLADDLRSNGSNRLKAKLKLSFSSVSCIKAQSYTLLCQCPPLLGAPPTMSYLILKLADDLRSNGSNRLKAKLQLSFSSISCIKAQSYTLLCQCPPLLGAQPAVSYLILKLADDLRSNVSNRLKAKLKLSFSSVSCIKAQSYTLLSQCPPLLSAQPAMSYLILELADDLRSHGSNRLTAKLKLSFSSVSCIKAQSYTLLCQCPPLLGVQPAVSYLILEPEMSSSMCIQERSPPLCSSRFTVSGARYGFFTSNGLCPSDTQIWKR